MLRLGSAVGSSAGGRGRHRYITGVSQVCLRYVTGVSQQLSLAPVHGLADADIHILDLSVGR